MLQDYAIQCTEFSNFDDAKVFTKVQRLASLRQRHTPKTLQFVSYCRHFIMQKFLGV